jgi:hypothetical protein
MNHSTIKTLLALWLAQQDTEVHLSQGEKSAIEELCHQLSENPDTWDSVQQELISTIKKNESLNQTFQDVQDRLNKLDTEELLELLPNAVESKTNLSNLGDTLTYDSSGSMTRLLELDQLLVQLKQQYRNSQKQSLEQFEALANEWKTEVGGSSFVAEKTRHPAYQKIIQMGPVVIPFLLRELEEKPTHWFEALKAITGANPIQPEQRGRTKQMAQAWLKWGRENGYEW